MRVLVCGGRDFDDWGLLDYILSETDKNCPISEIIHGDAKGADFLARVWARWKGITEVRFPANWNEHGRSAGPIRNKQMLDVGMPQIVIAFPGGNGTQDMVQQSIKAGVTVWDYRT